MAFLPENDVKVLANITVVPVYGTYKRDLNLHKIRTSFCCRQCFVYLVSTRAVNWCNFVSQRIGSEFFPDPDRIFFPASGPDSPKIRILSGKSGSMKKRPKTFKYRYRTRREILYFIFSTLNTVRFGQAPPKPNQNHHLDPISL